MIARHRWLKLLFVLPALPVLVTGGIWFFSGLTGPSIHPNAQSIPSSIPIQAPAEWSKAVDKARQIVRADLSAQNLPGLSIAVTSNGATIWAEGFGWEDLKTKSPVTPQTRFRIGSLSPLFSAAAAGLLVEQGKLSPTKVPALQTASIPANDALSQQRCEQPADALTLTPTPNPWTLASDAIQGAAQQPFNAYLKEHLFAPLSMNNTGAQSTTEENPERIGEDAEDAPIFSAARNLVFEPLGIASVRPKPAGEPATIYEAGFGPNVFPRYHMHELRVRNLSCYAGALAYYSTPSDLAQFAAAIHRGQYLKASNAQSLQLAQSLNAGVQGELYDQKIASLLSIPQSGLVVAITTNYNAYTLDLARKVAATLSPIP